MAARGTTAPRGTRFRRFAEEVKAARDDGPRLVALQRQLRTEYDRGDLDWASRYLDDWVPPEPDPPPLGGYTVVQHDGTPLDDGPGEAS